MVSHVETVSPLPFIVNPEIRYYSVPDMGIGQGPIQIEEGSLVIDDVHSIWKEEQRRTDSYKVRRCKS